MSKLEMSIKTIDAKSMLIGFLLCAVGFLTIGATDSGLGKGILNVDGTLFVRGLVVTDDFYKPFEGDNVIITPDGMDMEQDEYKSRLYAGSITLTSKYEDLGEFKSTLYSTSLILEKNDKTSVQVLTTDNGTGQITTYNKFGNKVTALGVTNDDDGGVFLYDRYGDFGNSLTGKK